VGEEEGAAHKFILEKDSFLKLREVTKLQR
jgi:hypothetical protein